MKDLISRSGFEGKTK